MRNAARRAPIFDDLPPLVRSTVSFDGQPVDTSQQIWRFRSSLDGGKIIALDWAQHEKANVLSPHARLPQALLRRPDRAQEGKDD